MATSFSGERTVCNNLSLTKTSSVHMMIRYVAQIFMPKKKKIEIAEKLSKPLTNYQ
jgi:hypothetical protein